MGGIVITNSSLQILVCCFLCVLTRPIGAFHLIGDTFGVTFSELDRHGTSIHTAIDQRIALIGQRLRTSSLNGRLPPWERLAHRAASQYQAVCYPNPFHSIGSVADSWLAQPIPG